MDMNGPILWRIVCRARRTSNFYFLCTFIYFSVVHSIWTVVFEPLLKGALKIPNSTLS